MPFDSALDSTQKSYLRGNRQEGRVYISACSNTVVYSGRINQADYLYPLAQVAIDGGSGTVANIKVGMAVYFSHTNDIAAAYIRLIIRTAPVIVAGAGQLYISMTGDLGFADNDYFWVVADYPITDKLARISGDKPIPNWNQSFRELLPLIGNLRPIADWVDATTGVLEIPLAPSVLATAADAAIDTGSYLWTIPASGVTITAGSTTTKDITVEVDPAATEYWFSFQVADDNGNEQIFHFPVWAHDETYPPTLLSIANPKIDQEISRAVLDGAAAGYSMTLEAFAGMSTLLDNNLVCVWTDQFYGTTAVDLSSGGNILFYGRFRSEVNNTGYSMGRQASASFEIEGPLAQLARLRMDPMRIEDSSSPTEFNQIKDLTLWRGALQLLQEYSTFLEVHSLAFDDTGDNFRVPRLRTQGGDMLSTLSDLCQSINAVFQDNPAGMCEVARRLPMLPSADRSGVTLVLDITVADFGGPDAISLSIPQIKLVGLLRGDGGGYNTVTGNTSGYRVRAPNGVPLGVAGDALMPRQILIANQSASAEKDELEERAGNALAAMWGASVLRLRLPDGYHGLTPDAQARYTLTLPAAETVRGRAYTTSIYWWLQAKSLSINPQTGRIEPIFTFVRETSGTPGKVDPPYVGENYDGVDLSDEYIPPPEVESEPGDIDVTDGDIATGSVCGSALCEACFGGQHVIDVVFDLGEEKTLESVTINYDADASQPGNQSYVGLLRPAEFEGIIGGYFNVAAGTGVTRTINAGGRVARYIHVYLVGDTDACADSITLNDVDYVERRSRLLDTFTVNANNGGDTFSNIPLASGVKYRIRIKGSAFANGSGLEVDAAYEYVAGVWYPTSTAIGADPADCVGVYFDGVVAPRPINDVLDDVTHTYDYIRTGDGTTLSVRFVDCNGNYADNSGSWTVEIYKA